MSARGIAVEMLRGVWEGLCSVLIVVAAAAPILVLLLLVLLLGCADPPPNPQLPPHEGPVYPVTTR